MCVCERGLHSSHRLRITGEVVWCNACGCYAQQRLRDLKAPCKGGGDVPGGPRRSQLAALRDGRHPLNGDRLGATAIVQVEAKQARASKIPTAVAVQRLVGSVQAPVNRSIALALGRLLCH